LAGVSRATAARVLGGYGYVSEEARQKVYEAARQLGYRPHSIAQSMVTGRTKTIGLVVGDIENPFFAKMARGVSDTIIHEGYNLIVCSTNENPIDERSAIDGLCRKKVDGLIIAPASRREHSHIDELIEHKFPVVLVDRVLDVAGVDMIAVTNVEGAFDAVKHLLERGYREIAFLSDSFEISSNVERFEGYKRALAEKGLPIREDYIRTGSYTVEAGYREAVSLLSGTVRPEAVFAANNFMTIGVLRAAKDMHIAIPGQLALVGFDEMDWLELVSPTITAIAQPVYELGQVAAQRLLRRIAGDMTRPEVIRLSTRLIPRESSGVNPVRTEEEIDEVR